MQLSIFASPNISRGLNESFKLKGFIRARTLTGGGLKWLFVICSACASQVVAPFLPNRLRDFGGLKWLFVICSACASQVVAPFFARTLTGGGLKWTRTIDLTLIRRVL